ncbi:MAG: hypothetical protein ABI543_02025 [Ignavibacteria bacterium]
MNKKGVPLCEPCENLNSSLTNCLNGFGSYEDKQNPLIDPWAELENILPPDGCVSSGGM